MVSKLKIMAMLGLKSYFCEFMKWVEKAIHDRRATFANVVVN